MARPCKPRRICAMPRCESFGPKKEDAWKDQIVLMTVDEFETIRLIDLEGMTQEQCAQQMNIARTTAQSIYNNARKKLAQCLVMAKSLHIQGGDIALCDGQASRCRCSCPHKKGCSQ